MEVSGCVSKHIYLLFNEDFFLKNGDIFYDVHIFPKEFLNVICFHYLTLLFNFSLFTDSISECTMLELQEHFIIALISNFDLPGSCLWERQLQSCTQV